MHNKTILIKYGGNAMLNEALQNEIAEKIKALVEQKIQVVLVHGGGPFINKALETAGIESTFIDGHRYTTPQALTKIETTLKGEVNSQLVGIFNRAGLKAVGLSGKDGQMVIAKKRWHIDATNGSKIDLGQVGDVKSIEQNLINKLLINGFTPVITCIASDEAGVDYNINADMFAGHLAAALKVDAYIVLTDVDGLYKDYPDPSSIISEISLSEISELYNTVIKGGMIPKIESCEISLNGGAVRAVILNGTKPEQIEEYAVHQQQVGTTIKR